MSLLRFHFHIEGLDDEDRDEAVYRFEERAGIAQDSGATKREAEAIAWEEVKP